jgi:hypothetical protein
VVCCITAGLVLKPHSPCSHRQKKEVFDLDENLVREYFAVGHVVDTILTLYSELLGLRFQQAGALEKIRLASEGGLRR